MDHRQPAARRRHPTAIPRPLVEAVHPVRMADSDTKSKSVAAGSGSAAADAFAECQDYNQKVDALIFLAVQGTNASDGKALGEWLAAQKAPESGNRTIGGAPDEDPGATGSDLTQP